MSDQVAVCDVLQLLADVIAKPGDIQEHLANLELLPAITAAS